MILVDDAGGAFPAINHAPWFGVTLADFVMPFFLFGVGVSVSLVFKVSSNTRIRAVDYQFLKLVETTRTNNCSVHCLSCVFCLVDIYSTSLVL